MSCSNQFSAKLPEELSCYLNGIIVLPDGNEVCILDRENATLKKFTQTGEPVHRLSLIDIPHSMCLIPDLPKNQGKHIVITKPDRSVLEFVEADQFTIKKYIHTDKKYYGVCYIISAEHLVVSSWSQLCVDILDTNGIVLHSITQEVNPSTPMFQTPNEEPDLLCVTSSGDIVISGINSFVKCIDKEGNLKWKKNIEGQISGLCCDENRKRIIVSLKDQRSIISIDEKDNEIKTLSLLADLSLIPLQVCMFENGMLFTETNGQIFKQILHR